LWSIPFGTYSRIFPEKIDVSETTIPFEFIQIRKSVPFPRIYLRKEHRKNAWHMTKERAKKSKKVSKKAGSTKKDFQKIIDILDGVEPKVTESISPFMDIYWAEESEVPKEEDPGKTGS
jgi:hypothetical protein